MSSGVAASVLSTAYNVITAGLGGIGLLAFFNRWIVPGATLDDVKTERDQWKALYEQERTAHQATIAAFTASSQRSDAGVEAAKVTIALVEALKGSTPTSGGPGRSQSPAT